MGRVRRVAPRGTEQEGLGRMVLTKERERYRITALTVRTGLSTVRRYGTAIRYWGDEYGTVVRYGDSFKIFYFPGHAKGGPCDVPGPRLEPRGGAVHSLWDMAHPYLKVSLGSVLLSGGVDI